jgi:hypothetical protein
MLMFVMTETPRFGIVLHSTPVGSALDDDDLDQSVSQSGRLVSVSPRGCVVSQLLLSYKTSTRR